MMTEVHRYDHADCEPKAAAWFFEGGQLWVAVHGGEVLGTLSVNARRVIGMLAVATSARGGAISRTLLVRAQQDVAPAVLLHDNHMSVGGEYLMDDFGISAEPGTEFKRLSDGEAELRAEQAITRARKFLEAVNNTRRTRSPALAEDSATPGEG